MDIKTQWNRKISFFSECHVAFVINEKSPKDNRFTLSFNLSASSLLPGRGEKSREKSLVGK